MDPGRGRLLGREQELEVLRGALGDVRQGGTSRFVLVSGEAGIGKSRLLEELASEARADGGLSLTGRAAEFEADVPFAAVVDALDSYLRTLHDHDVERLSLDRFGELAAVFPALGRLGDAVSVPVNSAERFRVYRAVGELLERLAARQPVVLVLDDLHWADPASLELAAHLVRRPPEAAVMVAFGVRSQASAETRRTLVSIERSPVVTTIDLPPLPVGVVRELVDTDRATADRLHHLSGGNPLFALQLARAGPLPATADPYEGGVPGSVIRSIESELADLPDIAAEVASAAAVVGDPFDLDLVLAATECPERDVLDGLDHLSMHALVRQGAAPRQFQFRHPLVRNAVYAATPPGTRVARHRRVADHLEARGATAVERARHVEHSARHGDTLAIEVLEQAAGSVVAHAPASAVRWISTALALLPATASPQRRIGLLGELAIAHAALGDLRSGLATLRHGLAIVPTGDQLTRTQVSIACSEGERLLGEPDLAVRTLRTAYEQLDERESSDAVRLCIALSISSFYATEYDAMLTWADEAGRLAEALGDDVLLVASYAARTAGATFVGQLDLAFDLHRRTTPLLDRLADAALAPQLDVLGSLSTAELYLDLYDDALAHATRGLAIARRSGKAHLVPVFGPIAGSSAWMIGEYERAFQVLDDAIETARLLDNDATLAWHLFNRALAALMSGDVEGADRWSAESWALAEPMGDGLVPSFAALTRAQVMHELGRSAEAVELAHQRAGGPEVTSIGGGWRGIYLELLVRCHLAAGDPAEGRTAAVRCRRHADAVPLHIASMAADRADAAVALAGGDPAAAARFATAALHHAEQMRSPVHVATCQALLGRSCVAAGALDEAVAWLRRSSEGYDTIGAARYRDEVDADLRRLGEVVHRRSRPGGRASTGVDVLTGRELEVAELIRDRLTNREIAEQLFLSLKTVESHVRNIFNKLDVSSRVEVARVLEGHRRAPG